MHLFDSQNITHGQHEAFHVSGCEFYWYLHQAVFTTAASNIAV